MAMMKASSRACYFAITSPFVTAFVNLLESINYCFLGAFEYLNINICYCTAVLFTFGPHCVIKYLLSLKSIVRQWSVPLVIIQNLS